MQTGTLMIVAGVILIIIGVWITFVGPLPALGRLPGDIVVKRDGISFYFPITTCLLLSLVVTLVMTWIRRP